MTDAGTEVLPALPTSREADAPAEAMPADGAEGIARQHERLDKLLFEAPVAGSRNDLLP